MASNKFSARIDWDSLRNENVKRVGYSPRDVEASLAHYDDAASADVTVDARLGLNAAGEVMGFVEVKGSDGSHVYIRISNGVIA